MNRRGFLKALGAIGAGIALRPIPVLGERFSVLESPVSVAVPAMPTAWGFTVGNLLRNAPLWKQLTGTDRVDAQFLVFPELVWGVVTTRGNLYSAFTVLDETTPIDTYVSKVKYALDRGVHTQERLADVTG